MMADDFLAKLANNAEYQRKVQEKERARASAEAQFRFEEAALVQDLQTTGLHVVVNRIPGESYLGPPRSITDLVNTSSPYPDAIPILVKHLQIEYSRPIRESIIRALTTPESKGHADVLIKAFEAEQDSESQTKWLLGAAIAEAATADDTEKIISLANDIRHGQGRAFLPLGLVVAPKSRAIPILEHWQSDSTLRDCAKKAIRIVRTQS